MGIFDFESITLWIDRVLKGKVSTEDLSKELTIETKDCQEIHRLIKEREVQAASSSIEEDEILKEILEEERKKKEAFEKEFGDKKKNKKKKKKKSDEL